ncbi:MAG: hypothetical protein CMO81_09100 [Waddliaceae bacterium]|nr:hypothetical protein [Waddliaceae bacterium]
MEAVADLQAENILPEQSDNVIDESKNEGCMASGQKVKWTKSHALGQLAGKILLMLGAIGLQVGVTAAISAALPPVGIVLVIGGGLAGFGFGAYLLFKHYWSDPNYASYCRKEYDKQTFGALIFRFGWDKVQDIFSEDELKERFEKFVSDSKLDSHTLMRRYKEKLGNYEFTRPVMKELVMKELESIQTWDEYCEKYGSDLFRYGILTSEDCEQVRLRLQELSSSELETQKETISEVE